MTTIIAIDPGASGGIAIEHCGKLVVYAMPKTEGDVLDVLRTAIVNGKREGNEVVCVLELVGGFIKGATAPGSAMFNFGSGWGFLKGVVMAYQVRLELVRPQDWQKTLHLGTSASIGSKSAWKAKLKAQAQRLFPDQNVTLKTADALLILEYARRAGK
jgi:hypothetical protein